MRRMKREGMVDFLDYPRSVRDAAEEIYDSFNRSKIKEIMDGKEYPSKWVNITKRLSSEEAKQATELAFAWAAEDSMSSSKFPESKLRESHLDKVEDEILYRLMNSLSEEGGKYAAEELGTVLTNFTEMYSNNMGYTRDLLDFYNNLIYWIDKEANKVARNV